MVRAGFVPVLHTATGPISVTTPNGTGDSATNYIVGAATTPTITSFSPKSGPVGTSVTITGTNLTGATAVKFNGTTATITSNTATQIVATVPAGATTGKITVTTAGGTATSATDFTVTGPSHDRNISLHLRDSLVARGRVTVSDGFSACADTVPVKIQKKKSGHWKTVKSTTTSSSGRYRVDSGTSTAGTAPSPRRWRRERTSVAGLCRRRRGTSHVASAARAA